VFKQQAAAKSDNQCAFKPAGEVQACVNSYVLGLQKKLGLAGGCASVTPANFQGCVNAFLNEQMKLLLAARKAALPKPAAPAST
jgi:hypothetical protein